MTPRPAGYRRLEGSRLWHFCRNCSHWPTSYYDYSPSKPFDGELCPECLDKEAADQCQPNDATPS